GIEGADGFFFDEKSFVDARMPARWDKWAFCLAADLAATQDGGDYTVFVLMARDPYGRFWVIDVWRRQLSSDRVRKLLLILAVWARSTFGNLTIRLPQDPGAAGKSQAEQLKDLLIGEGFPARLVKVVPVTGSKATRASGWAECVNVGNARLCPESSHHRVDGIIGDEDQGDWQFHFKREHRQFREDEEHEFDDQVDAAADAYNELSVGKRVLRAA
ncbi:hypothetical protein KW797_03200, partial [Candidatus Parcubacteria bacterium]|nr:hypothetical protein [Candidatus Parcubacteria bacterium]